MREFKKLPLELFIGYDIEQNSRVIELDASEMVEKYPSGILQLVCKRPGEETTYIAPSFEQDGGTLRWTLTSYDVEKAGQGLAIVALVDTSEESVKVLASHKIRTGIEEGLHFRDAEKVDPDDSLIARVLAAVSRAQAYAQDAKEEADRAEAALDDVGDAKDQAIADIETKGAETLDSIPSDYTTLSGDVSDLKSNLSNFGNDIASDFSTSKAYNTGEYVIYNRGLYRFINYHVAGNWKAADAQPVSVTEEIYPLLKFFDKGFDKISIISGYNITGNGQYQPATYASYCVDQESYFKIADNASTISIAGDKGLFVRFYDEDLKALGNGGQATASNYTVNILAADNPNLERDAKWVKLGGQSNFTGLTFTNLIPGRFVSVADKLNSVDTQLESMDETLDSIVNYRTITQTDMAEGYIIYSAGGRAVNTDYVYIEAVPVIPKQKVYMTAYFGGGVTNSGGISGYDENGDFKCRVFDGPINGNPDTSRTQYLNKEIIIPDGVYYIAFSTRKDGTAPIKLALGTMFDPTTIVNEAIRKHEIIDRYGTVFDEEVKASIEAVQTVLASSGTPMLTMAVFTDLHHDPKYPNDPINDMFANIKAINDRIHVDTLMNLGDAIDGQFQTQYQAEGCLSEVVTKMYETTKKSHNLTGNHDDNVQSTWADRGNLDSSERLTLLELNDVLFKGSSGEVHNPNHITDYYYDLDEYDIRVICIGLNYTSYVQATQTWLETIALNTSKKVLVFSHCATKAEWGYMNDISNGTYVETPLNNFVNSGGTVIAFIHGHTHGDMIETDSSIQFTEVAIGCAKFSVPTSGTEGIIYQPRDAGDYTKILFDLVCVDQTNRKVHFIRCGAGSDRVISF